MPIDDLAEGVIRILGRCIGRFLLEILFEFICYWVGWVSLKIVTFGRYPKDYFDDSSDTACSVVGLIVIISVIAAIAYFLEAG